MPLVLQLEPAVLCSRGLSPALCSSVLGCAAGTAASAGLPQGWSWALLSGSAAAGAASSAHPRDCFNENYRAFFQLPGNNCIGSWLMSARLDLIREKEMDLSVRVTSLGLPTDASQRVGSARRFLGEIPGKVGGKVLEMQLSSWPSLSQGGRGSERVG